jgi:hypothetical protein
VLPWQPSIPEKPSSSTRDARFFRVRSSSLFVAISAALCATGALLAFAQDNPELPAPIVTLRDGDTCYYRNHFFERNVQARIAIKTGDLRDEWPVDHDGRSDITALGIASPLGAPPGSYFYIASCGALESQQFLSHPSATSEVRLVLPNSAPVLTSLVATVGGSVVTGAPKNSIVTLTANATDPDGDQLFYTWAANSGVIASVQGSTAEWKLPDSRGLAFAYVLVTDGKGAFREGSTIISTDAGVVPAAPVATAPALPSDRLIAQDHFLTFFSTRAGGFTEGADSRRGSCEYYRAIGAVQGCSPTGELLGSQLNFDSWKAKWGLTAETAGFHATYANIRDLDLERDMHGITTAQGTAYYVCNFPHVREGRTDTALLNVTRRENLVACVAMEFSPMPGVSGGQPFAKFLVFGPAGQLLQSVNLDGRGEKFLPGSCVVCHGARTDFTRFDEDGTTSADLGAQFLPFDLHNFAYADSAGPLSQSAQETSFRNLNMTILATNPRPAIRELINLWYPDPSLSTFTDRIPPGWLGHEVLYTKTFQKYCRTCHVAMSTRADHNLAFQTFSQFDERKFVLHDRACGLQGAIGRLRWSMPNAKITFDQFWNDSVAIETLRQYLAADSCIKP